MDYQEYLDSLDWKRRRAGALMRANNACQICNSKEDLQVHHRTYARLGHEDELDLTVLCDKCHRLFHENGRMPTLPEPKIERTPEERLALMVESARIHREAVARNEAAKVELVARLSTGESRDAILADMEARWQRTRQRRADDIAHEIEREMRT